MSGIALAITERLRRLDVDSGRRHAPEIAELVNHVMILDLAREHAANNAENASHELDEYRAAVESLLRKP